MFHLYSNLLLAAVLLANVCAAPSKSSMTFADSPTIPTGGFVLAGTVTQTQSEERDLEMFHKIIQLAENDYSEPMRINALQAHFNTKDLVSVLLTGIKKKYPNYNRAVQLLSELRWSWLDQKFTVNHVAEILGIRNSESDLNFKIYMLDMYIKMYSERVEPINFLEILTQTFGGEEKLLKALADVLEVKDQANYIRELAWKIKAGMLNKWESEEVRPERVLMMLHLDQSIDSVLLFGGSRSILMDYLSTANSDGTNELVKLLIKHYGHDAMADNLSLWVIENSALLIDRAKMYLSEFNYVDCQRTTKLAKKLAKNLLSTQLKELERQRKSINDVFDLFKFIQQGKPNISCYKLFALATYAYDNRSAIERLINILEYRFGGRNNLTKILLEIQKYAEGSSVSNQFIQKMLHFINQDRTSTSRQRHVA